MKPTQNATRNLHCLMFTAFFILSITHVWGSNSDNKTKTNLTTLLNQNGKRAIPAVPIEDRVVIDGRLDDLVWQTAVFQGDFKQREPDEGDPASERTEVAVLYDKKYLYFGIKCFDKEPEKIIAREMRRDALVDDDDYFEMVLDTYHDKRSAYYFITNAHGSKREAVLANEGRDYNPAWNGIWKCKARITNEGWFLEIAIPWKTLRFKEEHLSVWGINFARMIRRKNEHAFWQMIPRALGRSNLFRISEAGTLENLTDMKMGGNLELRPYFLGGLENDSGTDFKTDGLIDLGLDTKIAITPNLALDLTVNTDFAQVEADQEQVNLTRFSLYYPEKRDFFLEGAETFSFGGSGGGHWHGGSSDLNLFYSRRLGLVDGHEARILGGAKMVGKIGQYRIGLMYIYTDEVSYEDEEDTLHVNPTHFTVFRLSKDILSRGSIGLMLLNKEETKSDHYNRSVGLDGLFPLSDYFTISSYIAGTFGPNQEDDGQVLDMNQRNLAGKLSLDYNSDRWQISTSHQDVGVLFNPEMGFNRRTDYRLTKASLEYSPRPAQPSAIRKFGYQISGDYRSDHHGIMLDSKVAASFSIEFQSSARFSFDVNRNNEFVDYDWEVRDGFLIPAGTYSGYDYSMRIESDKSRSIAGSINVNYGNYYTGRNMRLGVDGTITKIRRIRMEIDYSHNYVNLPEGTFHTNTLGLRTFYFFSTQLYLKAYIQWNDDKYYNEGSEKIISNILLRWIYSPESNLYIVYNDGRLIGPGNNEITNRTFMVKATFFWRK